MKSKTCKQAPKVVLILLLGLLISNSPVYAQDETDTTPKTKTNEQVVKIEGCDFEFTLPSQPRILERCKNPKTSNGLQNRQPNECYDVYFYTQTYGIDGSLNVEISCHPSTAATFNQYDETVMGIALRGMVGHKNLHNHSIGYKNENPAVKIASLSGMDKKGMEDNIFTAQLWVSDSSLLSFKGELTGDKSQDADIEFSAILDSITYSPETARKDAREEDGEVPMSSSAQDDDDEDDE